MTLHNTIVAGSYKFGTNNTPSDILAFSGAVNLVSSNNLIGTDEAGGLNNGVSGNQINVANPGLGPLANNGGPTQTHAISVSSPAFNAGNNAQVSGTTDQRGGAFARIANGTVDIGAFEVEPVNLVVDTDVDEIDGNYNPGDLSLREAINLANAFAGPDVITFSPSFFNVPRTITLTMGQLELRSDVTIAGPGASLLTIDANSASRALNVDDGNAMNDKAVFLSGLTLTGGQLSDTNDSGSGIRSREDLTLVACTIGGNVAFGSGGGIWQFGGSLAIRDCTISDNTARTGGGLSVVNGTASIEGTTISGNHATVLAGGGVILSISNATISSSTISGNSAHTFGGGIFSFSPNLVIKHSTITGNQSGADGGLGSGGGLAVADYSNGATLDHVIVAGNYRGSAAVRDEVYVDVNSFGPVVASYSLIGDKTGTVLVEAPVGSPDANGNLIGGPVHGVIDPMLGPLADNGGLTHTHALLAGSPAIDAGNWAAVAGATGVPLFDQRGNPFSRVFDGDGTGGARIDMGAYERQTVAGLNLVVDSLIDESNGEYSAGELSLREAIGLANGSIGNNVITFAAPLTSSGPAAVLLTQGELKVNEELAINGPGANLITIDAQGQSRILHILATTGDFIISGLTLTGGRMTEIGSASGGGGVRSRTDGSLTFSRCTIAGNYTLGESAHGGGVQAAGSVTLNQSTISGNSTAGAGAEGGGIWAAGFVALNQSTVSGNSTAGDNASGGGIGAYGGNVTVSQSTITGNSTFGRGSEGGGIFQFDSANNHSLSFSGSIISGNGRTQYDLQLVKGFNLFANQLNNGDNSLETILPNVPDGTTFYTFNSATQTWDVADTFTAGFGWSNGDTILSPGGGGFLQLPEPATVTMIGRFPQGVLSLDLQPGFQIISQMTPEAISLDAAGFPANDGDRILFFDTATQAYEVPFTFIESIGWFREDLGFVHPTPAVGEAFMYIRQGPPATWTRISMSDLVKDPGSTLTSNFSLLGTGVVPDAGENNLFNDSPMLGLLADNGGPTQTHALLPNSPAIDAGNPAAVAGMSDVPEFDQRGAPFSRVFDGDGTGHARIDMGAFELIPQNAIATLFGDYNQNGSVDAADYTVWRDTLGQTGITPISGADGDGDGNITQGDYNVWRTNFGQSLPAPAAGTGATSIASATSNLEANAPVALASVETTTPTISANSDTMRALSFAAATPGFTRRHFGHRSVMRDHTVEPSVSVDDHLLVLLASDRLSRARPPEFLFTKAGENEDEPDGDPPGPANEPLAVALAEWR